MIKRNLKFILTFLAIMNLFPHFINAKSELIIYSLDSYRIPNYLKDYLNSVDLKQINDIYTLYINGKEIESSSNLSFTYCPQNDVSISFKYSLPDNVLITYSAIEETVITSRFEIFMDDGIQTVRFYPDIKNNEYIEKTAVLLSDIYDFGEFECLFGKKTYHFKIEINNLEDKAYITKNKIKQEYDLKSGGVVSRIFLETHVNYHTLNIDSTKKLTPKSFSIVKNNNYSNAEIDNIVSDEKLLLVHRKTGLSKEDHLFRIIDYWKRIDEDNYDTNYSNQIQVVAQYNEDAGEFARTKEREYIVLGNNYSYDYLASETKKVEEKVYYNLYQNVHWYDSDFVNSKSFPEKKTYRLIQYSTRTGSWGKYTDYNYSSYTSCAEDEYCGYTSKTFYAKSTRTKTTTSQLQKSTGAVNSWSSYVDNSNKPKDTDTTRYQTYYKYTCKKSILSTTVYSYVGYSIGEQGPCSSGYKISAKSTGYRYGSVTWSDYSNTSMCSNSTSYTKCRSIEKETYGDWSKYSDYTYTSCSDNDTTKCQSKSKYAYRYISFDNWTNYQNTTSPIDSSKLKEVKYRYNDGSLAWETIKGTSSTIGVSPYYTGNTTTNSYSEYVDKKYAKIIKKEVGELYNQTENNIKSLANLIAKNAQYKAIFENNDGEILYDDLIDIYNNNPNIYSSSKTLAYNSFLNANIYLPYIYVKDHYRAIACNMNVGGYQDELTSISTISIPINKEDEFDLIISKQPLSRDTKVIYFDNRNPFYHYEELPKNWIDASFWIEKIKNANKNNYSYRYLYKDGVLTKY